MRTLESYLQGRWAAGEGQSETLFNAVTGEEIAAVSTKGLDLKGAIEYGRNVGGPALRKLTIHERSRRLKSLAFHLMDIKDQFYATSAWSGATKADSWIDIEGGIGTLFTYASKGRRELADKHFIVDGKPEPLSKGGTFIGQHIAVPLEGVAVHINAYNFPIWGMLEKLSPTIVAGMPAIIKPASATAYLTEQMVKAIIDSGFLPEGSLQLVTGSAGDMLDHVDYQDVVTFTGSAWTGRKLKSHPKIIENSVRFNMEADSLNFSMLGENDAPGTPEFDLFIKEVMREVTVKSGQKCTAIRRTIVPEKYVEDVRNALAKAIGSRTLGDPQKEGTKMGPLAGRKQAEDVRQALEKLKQEAEVVYGGGSDFEVNGADNSSGAFFPGTLLFADNPTSKTTIHEVEAFGPVTTMMPYKTRDEAIELAKLGRGALVGSVFSADDDFTREIVMGTAAHHGRLHLINRHSAKESTGHGSPLPQMVHGGPGRAGGGEELGGIRSVYHYMQRTALQGDPTTLTRITGDLMPGHRRVEADRHPFTKYYHELTVGEQLTTHRRTITETDIVNFANLSWDIFYAHTDETSIEDSIFEKRVAHGYFVISAAAGLFVNPKPGPVLANYGLDELRFTMPCYAGDTIYAKLTVKSKEEKEPKEDQKLQGVVKWQVEVFRYNTNPEEEDEMVALATILTLVERER
ncbi:MAG: phenylacetic acid degradation bifunctional protein PaaZ [Candidatus Kapaibacteriales bacterium]